MATTSETSNVRLMKNIRHFANLTQNIFWFKTYYSTLQNTDEKKILLIRWAQILIICESLLVVAGKLSAKKQNKTNSTSKLFGSTHCIFECIRWVVWLGSWEYCVWLCHPTPETLWPTDHPRPVHGPLKHIAHKNGSSNLIGYLAQLPRVRVHQTAKK